MNNLTKLGYVNGVYTFKFDTFGVCPKNMFMKVDDNKRLIDLKIMGGCDGNSKAVSILVTGLTLEDIITKLRNLSPKELSSLIECPFQRIVASLSPIYPNEAVM